MVGTEIIDRRWPRAAIVLLISGLALAPLWFTPAPTPIRYIAGGPLAAMLLVGLKRPDLRLRIDRDSVSQQQPINRTLPLAEVGSVEIRGRGDPPAADNLTIVGLGEPLTIRRSEALSISRLFEWILGKIGFGTRVSLRLLSDYQTAAIESFGASKVYAFASRPPSVISERSTALIVGTISTFVIGTCIAAMAMEGRDKDDTQFTGPFCGFWGIALIGSVIAYLHNRNPAFKAAELVITPAGFALSQGKLVGDLKWVDVRGLTYGRVQTESGFGNGGHGLRVKIDGGIVCIGNIYNRPIAAMMRIMRQYWQGSDKCSNCKADLPTMGGPVCPHCSADTPPIA